MSPPSDNAPESRSAPRHLSTDELDEAFRELSRIQRAPEGAADLIQFRALASARQYRHLYRAVARHFRPGEALLDWGCGNGHASWTLLRLGWGPVTGYGFEDFPLRPRIPEDGFRFLKGEGQDPVRLPFDDASFDGVLSVGVLEHVRETGGDEGESLAEIRRVLRPGGRFLCVHFPNRTSWIEFLARRSPRRYHHLHRYTTSDIRALAHGAGLELVEHRRYGILPRNFWGKAPRALRASSRVARGWDAGDRLLERVLPWFTQNHLWVARRPGDGEFP